MSRQLAIGDIHGCFDALDTLVAFVGLRSDDVLIALGDYVDRGPKTRQVIEWLMDWDASGILIPLRGNHEVMMLNARTSREARYRWTQFGAIPTLDSYATYKDEVIGIDELPESHWQFLSERLLPYHETDKHIFVHATLDPSVPVSNQKDQSLYWDRFSPNYPGHCSGKTIVCGHTCQDSGWPVTNGHSICIDTGACKNGWLTCLEVASGTVWQANESRQTRLFTLDQVPQAADSDPHSGKT
jgi:serine/threonine protein phosphatase 1